MCESQCEHFPEYRMVSLGDMGERLHKGCAEFHGMKRSLGRTGIPKGFRNLFGQGDFPLAVNNGRVQAFPTSLGERRSSTREICVPRQCFPQLDQFFMFRIAQKLA